MSSSATIVVADPDSASREFLAELLGEQGIRVHACEQGVDVLATLDREPAQVVISDLTLPDMSAVSLLRRLSERWPGLPVVVLAENASVASVVSALKAGADDFLQKPFDPDEIKFVVQKALTSVARRADEPPPPTSSARAKILGESAAMSQVHATLQRASQGRATVLIRGESGTGKELVARALHEASPRSEEAFVKIDCAALPDNLLESELFGYERGAFTGAVARKPGRVELANKGTLFLDEIGELGLPLQAKLLRLLQDRQLERLGGTKIIEVDVRVVAATHRDLEGMTERGEFRQDLFYRLNVVPLWLPPLRARRDDIVLLAQHFLKECATANGRPGIRITSDALAALRSQNWPGNVRQLQNFVERLVVLSAGEVLGEAEVRGELARQVRFKTQSAALTNAAASSAPAKPSPRPEVSAPTLEPEGAPIRPLEAAVREAEKVALERALRSTKHNRSHAARLLGVSRSTLYLKLKEHKLI